MKRKIILYAMTLLLSNFFAKAQLVESEAYVINSNLAHHSQIIHNYNDDLSIVLSRTNTGNYRFHTIENGGNGSSRYVDFPINFTIKDFKILDDTVYFCGIETSNGNQGFIAYVHINDLFSATTLNNTLGKISYIPYVHDIRKLVAYYQNSLPGRIKVCAIGQMHESYATPSYLFECLINLDISFPNPNYPPYNFYYIYKTPWANATEELYDIKLTENFLCLVSINKSFYPNGYYPFYLIRTFDKFNFNFQNTNMFISNTLPIVGNLDHNTLLEPLNRDTIALAYTAAFDPTSTSDFVNIVHKINLGSGNIFQPINTSYFDIKQEIYNINDMKFDKDIDKLLLLKETDFGIGVKEDALWYIDISSNATYPYFASVVNIPANSLSQSFVTFNGISERANKHYRISGVTDNNNLINYNKFFDYLNPTSSCYNIFDYNIEEATTPTNYLNTNLDMIYTSPPMTAPIIYLQNLSIPIFNNSNSYMQCQSY